MENNLDLGNPEQSKKPIRQCQYPYQNMFLVNMAGETWKDLPGFEGYYMVSNKGRIKSLPREIVHDVGTHQIRYLSEERILKQTIKEENGLSHLVFKTSVEKQTRRLVTARIVYEIFVGPIPSGMVARHIGDRMDNSVENLYLSTRFELNGIEVSRYDTGGEYMGTYSSIKHASRKLGISETGIVEALKGRQYTAGNFFWRKGRDKTRMDVSISYKRMEERQKYTAKVNSRSIVRYNLNGEYMDTHESIRAAADNTGISIDAIKYALRKKRYLSRGFIWEYADLFRNGRIPKKINADKYLLPVQMKKQNRR